MFALKKNDCVFFFVSVHLLALTSIDLFTFSGNCIQNALEEIIAFACASILNFHQYSLLHEPKCYFTSVRLFTIGHKQTPINYHIPFSFRSSSHFCSLLFYFAIDSNFIDSEILSWVTVDAIHSAKWIFVNNCSLLGLPTLSIQLNCVLAVLAFKDTNCFYDAALFPIFIFFRLPIDNCLNSWTIRLSANVTGSISPDAGEYVVTRTQLQNDELYPRHTSNGCLQYSQTCRLRRMNDATLESFVAWRKTFRFVVQRNARKHRTKRYALAFAFT